MATMMEPAFMKVESLKVRTKVSLTKAMTNNHPMKQTHPRNRMKLLRRNKNKEKRLRTGTTEAQLPTRR